MDRVKEYLSNPTTWISFTVFVFWLGWAWVSLNSRISAVEKAQADMDIAYIQSTLAQIQTDIQWIKIELQK
jgi:hypothetical protein